VPTSYLGAEQAMVDAWVDGVLKGNTAFNAISPNLATRVFPQVAPDGTGYPFIVYQAQTPPHDVRGVGPNRVMVDTLYIVKAVAQVASYDALADVAHQIDVVMTAAEPQAITGGLGTILCSVREDGFSLTESASGTLYRHLGGQYRILAQAS
jgi:hypothetical protein